ncbi:hypothetical protein TrCOL_g9091 [Triparma columacea]|uniref:Uncharacterized protein n=1 Tax=Triparma columacea TaxID=722753 RepID=A0A9W7L790_9STRA|nr:hypothetical protein TrCOL_g9091 [Triparma columacea]
MVSVPKKSAKKTAKKSDTKSPKKAPKKSNQKSPKNSRKTASKNRRASGSNRKEAATKTAADTANPITNAAEGEEGRVTVSNLPVDAPALTHVTVTIPVGAEAANFTMRTLLTGQMQLSSNLIELRGLLVKITKRLDELSS